jgi:Protein kinase domain
MDSATRLLVMLTAARSIETLHVAGLVHGDIKPENVLIKWASTNFTAKIIDFDNCFIAHEPPPKEELVGDPAYYSPELMQYVMDGTGAANLSTASDVFALGLVFMQYVTGSSPALPSSHKYAAEAITAGWTIPTHVSASRDRVSALIAAMIDSDPAGRPSMREVHTRLKEIRRTGEAIADKPPPRRSLVGTMRTGGSAFVDDARTEASAGIGFLGKLRSRMAGRMSESVLDTTGPHPAETRPADGPVADAPAPEAPPTEGRLTGTLRGKDKAKSDPAPAPAGPEGQLKGKLAKKNHRPVVSVARTGPARTAVIQRACPLARPGRGPGHPSRPPGHPDVPHRDRTADRAPGGRIGHGRG